MNPGSKLLQDLKFELALMKMTNAERATAIQLRGMEADQVQKYGDAIAEENRKIEDQLRRTELVDGFRSEFNGMVGDVLKGTKSAKDAVLDMMDSIQARLLDRIAGNFTDWLFGEQGQAGGGKAGGWLDAIAGIFGKGGGGASTGSSGGGWLSSIGSMLGGLFGGGRAYGGDVRRDRMYRVGERNQPELLNLGRGAQYLIPGDAGRVEPAGASQRSAASVSVSAPITVQGRVDRRTAARIAQETVVKGRTAVVRNGGAA